MGAAPAAPTGRRTQAAATAATSPRASSRAHRAPLRNALATRARRGTRMSAPLGLLPTAAVEIRRILVSSPSATPAVIPRRAHLSSLCQVHNSEPRGVAC